MGGDALVDILVRFDPDVASGSESSSDSFVIRMLDFAVHFKCNFAISGSPRYCGKVEERTE